MAEFEYPGKEKKPTNYSITVYLILIILSCFLCAVLMGYLFAMISLSDSIIQNAKQTQMCSFSLEGDFSPNITSQVFPEGMKEIFPNLKINKISGSIPCNSRILESIIN